MSTVCALVLSAIMIYSLLMSVIIEQMCSGTRMLSLAFLMTFAVSLTGAVFAAPLIGIPAFIVAILALIWICPTEPIGISLALRPPSNPPPNGHSSTERP